jgi:hypothetical protein
VSPRKPPPEANDLYVDALLDLAESAMRFGPIAAAREDGIADHQGAWSRRWNEDHRVAAERFVERYGELLAGWDTDERTDEEFELGDDLLNGSSLKYAGHRLVHFAEVVASVAVDLVRGDDDA